MGRRRRSCGTGSLNEENGNWYGRWLTVAGTYANRKVGPARQRGSREGLTKAQAEAKLRQMMDGDVPSVSTDALRTIEYVAVCTPRG